MGEMRNACTILVGKPEEKRTPERHSRRWKDTFTTVLKEMRYEGGELIHLPQYKNKWCTVRAGNEVRIP
jgi:hypothetical protein